MFGKLVKKGLTVTCIAELFGTTRQTVHRWLKRARHVGREYYRDRPREPKPGKVTDQVELCILTLRNTFMWRTVCIQQGLLRLPAFILESVRYVQQVQLSQESIYNVLTRHGVNGYPSDYNRRTFFRAKEPDELWEIDFKRPVHRAGRRHWFLVCIDDYSRFLVLARQFDHDPGTKEVTDLLERPRRLRRAILSDHASQFWEHWKKWCRWHGIETHYAHPSYLQDKGKVERCIQNLNRESINHVREFPEWLNGKLRQYGEWFNHSRYHRGIKAFPAKL